MHENLFQYGHSRSEVYASLDRHLKRDHYLMIFALVVTVILFGNAAEQGMHGGWPWFLGGMVSAIVGLLIHMDNANRNFMMHVFDWQDDVRRFPEEAE